MPASLIRELTLYPLSKESFWRPTQLRDNSCKIDMRTIVASYRPLRNVRISDPPWRVTKCIRTRQHHLYKRGLFIQLLRHNKQSIKDLTNRIPFNFSQKCQCSSGRWNNFIVRSVHPDIELTLVRSVQVRSFHPDFELTLVRSVHLDFELTLGQKEVFI